LLKDVCERLNVEPGQTTSDGSITVEFAECLGACDGAPCVLIEDELAERVDAEKALAAARS
jgi:NADH-quinone oxidoreductase subunit E